MRSGCRVLLAKAAGASAAASIVALVPISVGAPSMFTASATATASSAAALVRVVPSSESGLSARVTPAAPAATQAPRTLPRDAQPQDTDPNGQTQFSGTYGSPLIAGCTWATWVPDCSNLSVYGNGSSFGDSACGPPNGCTFGPEFQCTELAQRYAHYAFGEPDTWWGYGGGAASSFWTAGPKLPVPLQQFPNGGAVLPQQGDIIVFAPGWIGSYWDAPGHVAVVTGVDIAHGYVYIVEENGSPTGASRLTLNGTTVTGNGFTPTIGWLRDTGAGHPERLVSAGVAGRPVAVSVSPGVSEVVWRGADARLGVLVDNNGSTARLFSSDLPANMASDPAAVALPNGTVDVFWQSTTGELWLASSASRYRAQDLGVGGLASAPHAAASSSGLVAVTWTGSDGTLWNTVLSGTARTHATSTGDGGLASAPSPVYMDSGTLAVFWRGADGSLWWDLNGGAGWQGEQSLGNGPLASDPQPISPQAGAVDVFWLGSDSRAWQASYSGGAWSPAGAISGPGIVDTPYPLNLGHGSFSVFLRTSAASLAVATFDPSAGWLGPATLGDGPVGSSPTGSMTATTGAVDLFWKGSDGGLWDASAW